MIRRIWRNGPVLIVVLQSSLVQNALFVTPKNQRNMLTLGKLFQAMGIAIVGIGFISNFPELINWKSALLGIVLFSIGWSVERYFVK
ncbi:MAG TPA: hypothetical protein EYO24_04605 [Candidatus Marinimicrobia bacterium]|nr:hypothetical protein [Candidatus Neomarinimicrobiota bacterium]HIB52748.1 hypothetical protein [Candidatus Neomarinimicrobiota bacterium]